MIRVWNDNYARKAMQAVNHLKVQIIAKRKSTFKFCEALPCCTLVSGLDDPSMGGGRLSAMTPFTRSGYTP
jgi:hypothetical protein